MNGDAPSLQHVIEALSLKVIVLMNWEIENMYGPKVAMSRYPYVIYLYKEKDRYSPLISKDLLMLVNLPTLTNPKSLADHFFSEASMLNPKMINNIKKKINTSRIDTSKKMASKISKETCCDSALKYYKYCQNMLMSFEMPSENPILTGYINSNHEQVLESYISGAYSRFKATAKLPYYSAIKKANCKVKLGKCSKCYQNTVIIDNFFECPPDTHLNICGLCFYKDVLSRKSYMCNCSMHNLSVYQLSLINMNSILCENNDAKSLIFFPAPSCDNEEHFGEDIFPKESHVENSVLPDTVVDSLKSRRLM